MLGSRKCYLVTYSQSARLCEKGLHQDLCNYRQRCWMMIILHDLSNLFVCVCFCQRHPELVFIRQIGFAFQLTQKSSQIHGWKQGILHLLGSAHLGSHLCSLAQSHQFVSQEFLQHSENVSPLMFLKLWRLAIILSKIYFFIFFWVSTTPPKVH